MTVDAGTLVLLWAAINGSSLVVTGLLLLEAGKDYRAVKGINGKAREMAVRGDIRREVVRLAIQGLLLSLLVVRGFGFVVVLVAVALLLLTQSVLDLRERRKLTLTIARESRR